MTVVPDPENPEEGGERAASKDTPGPPEPPGAPSASTDEPVSSPRSASLRRPSMPATPHRRPHPDRALQAAWVERLQAGDEASLQEVIQAFGERISAVVAGILRDRDAVEDVVQATFTKAWFRIGSFRGRSGLYTWLYRVAVNTCKDYIKSRNRRPTQRLDERREGQLPSGAPHVIEGIEQRELRGRVRAAIAALPERYRVVLALRELEGMSYAEVAEVTGLSLGTVESRLFRARRRLRRLLASEAPGGLHRGRKEGRS